MEDAHVAQINLLGDRKMGVFGVFDGHNGYNVAKYAAAHIVDALVESQGFEQKNYKKAFEAAYEKIEKDLVDDAAFQKGGCTAVTVLITGDNSKIVCANVGDSRAIAVRKDGTVTPLSEDHKPTKASEAERIAAAGGTIEGGRVCGQIALTRALGDFEFKGDASRPAREQILSGVPDVLELPMARGQEKYIIIACDGVWDVLTNEECAKFIDAKMVELKNDIGLSCEALLDRCLAPTAPGLGTDNMTVVVIQFKDEYWV
eukprot:GILJ01023549.1.p1 GENE.GILJ01023549.1~~GILJ01023549.1.p1  ORF type:complete len:285 (-),score=49.85 GILJ01023549.1:76-852(-)